MNMMSTMERADLTVTRVRHVPKFRLAQVQRVQQLAPNYVRITFAGDDLKDFDSLSFDDHVKVFFPHDANGPMPVPSPLSLPGAGTQGLAFPDPATAPAKRDFTPRSFDPVSGELDIEFALHEAGPAATWAAQARVGQTLGIAGPKGSLVIPTGFDWHLLIGDETAMPAIARRLEELPATTRAIVLIEVADRAAELAVSTLATIEMHWCYRRAGDVEDSDLLQRLQAVQLPDGEGYVWAAGESALIRAARRYLIDERGLDKSRIRAASYWKRGAPDAHERFDD